MGDDELPADLVSIFEFLEAKIQGYGYLKWNEIAMVKADMMNVRHRWIGIDPGIFRAECSRIGMTPKETAEMTDYLRRTQAGRKLVPQRGYRDFRFAPEPERPDSEPLRGTTSRDW